MAFKVPNKSVSTTTKAAPAPDIAWPTVPSRLEIAEKCLPLEKKVKEVEIKAAGFTEVEDSVMAHGALEYLDFIKHAERSIEERRKKYVDSPNEFVKTLNTIVKEYTSRLSSARLTLANKVLAFQNKERARLQAEADAKRKAEEAEAEKRAKALEKKGDKESAEKLRDIAATAPAPKTDVKIRTESGVSSVITENWSGEVVNWPEFLNALVSMKGFLDGITFESLTVSKESLKWFAKQHKADKDKVLHGIKVTMTQTLGSR